MTAAVPSADPGATPTSDRVLAPDLARGGMLLLIALANVHCYVYGPPAGYRGYPATLQGLDQVVVLVQMTLVDGRAYPLFGMLFGYGIVQLARRRAALGLPPAAAVRPVRRRGFWLIVIGLVHGALLWSGDIVGAYGVLAVLMAGLLVRGTDRELLVVAGIGLALVAVLYAPAGFPPAPGSPPYVPSMAEPDPLAALLARAGEWALGLFNTLVLFAAPALGAWAARRGLLDDPQRHRRLLQRIAVVGLAAAALGGLPLALLAAGFWTAPPAALAVLAGAAHGVSGYLGGAGYAALFGLLAVRVARRGPGPVAGAVLACGRRSLSCYLAQSVAFVVLFPAWTLGLGATVTLWQAALAGAGVWLVILVVAAVSERVGYRGPAEILLRRLTYGRARQPSG